MGGDVHSDGDLRSPRTTQAVPDMTLFATEPANACAAFQNLRAAENPHTAAARAHCEDLWRDFQPFADNNFIEEFALHLQERWFEMYLTVTLLRAGLDVQARKPGPDVLLRVDGRRVWIEGTCATPGAPGLPDSVPPPQYAAIGEPPNVTARPTRQMALRLRNSLATKATVFRRYLAENIVGDEDVLVIAINVREVHGLWADMDEIMRRAFYGVGDLILTFDRTTSTVIGRQNEQLTHIAKQSTGAGVGVQPFIDNSMPHISAVIGSWADAANLPTHLGGDFLLLPNLTTCNPWRDGTIPIGTEWQFTADNAGWDGKRHSYLSEKSS